MEITKKFAKNIKEIAKSKKLKVGEMDIPKRIDEICYTKKTKSKIHCMFLDDEEYKLIIENRKKFKNTEGQK